MRELQRGVGWRQQPRRKALVKRIWTTMITSPVVVGGREAGQPPKSPDFHRMHRPTGEGGGKGGGGGGEGGTHLSVTSDSQPSSCVRACNVCGRGRERCSSSSSRKRNRSGV